ncbi:MAG: response regulator [Myxococcota bacterium]
MVSEIAGRVYHRRVAYKVLIVEDSSSMRAFARATLESNGDIVVEEASNGFEALRVLSQNHFDAVLLDINMPDINGLELISFMRKSQVHRQTPVVIVSTEAAEKDRNRAISLGADEYLEKPLEPERLLTVVYGWVKKNE